MLKPVFGDTRDFHCDDLYLKTVGTGAGHQIWEACHEIAVMLIDKNHQKKYGYPVTLLGDDLYSRQPICELALKQGYNFTS